MRQILLDIAEAALMGRPVEQLRFGHIATAYVVSGVVANGGILLLCVGVMAVLPR